MEFLDQLTDPGQFMPHGHCYFWTPEILWLHVFSDGIIALSYYSIPLALLVFAFKRPDVRFRWIFLMFGAFICACGTTHVMDIWTTWQPMYRLEGVIKAATAMISVTTAAMLWPLLPKALALPSPTQLEQLAASLERKVGERTEALEQRSAELAQANTELRAYNALAVGREERILELKAEVNALAARLGLVPRYAAIDAAGGQGA
ncbi:MAG: hypothetical protein HYV16_09195 [Gammaproteobacteria bacterium]|nr:hypothetical protein [Gammaproteobacteria bacterium]